MVFEYFKSGLFDVLFCNFDLSLEENILSRQLFLSTFSEKNVFYLFSSHTDQNSLSWGILELFQ
jgi:hypothetical protein